MDGPQTLAPIFARKGSYLFLAHLHPDGDVLGSMLGLGLALMGQGRRVTLAGPHPVPEPYRFLPGAHWIQQWKDASGSYDVTVLLDCPDPARTGGLLEAVRERGTTVVNIDHHQDNRRFGDLNWVDLSASATGEMVYDLLQHFGWSLTPEIATTLYTALVTDTGSFRYSNASPKAFRIAAHLVAEGAAPARVAGELYEGRSHENLRLLGQLLQRIETSADGRVAWLVLPSELAGNQDLIEAEDFIAYPRSIRSVKVALLFRELQPGQVKVSLRGKGEVNVAKIAARFGGGGHPNAAGCTVTLPMDAAKAALLDAVAHALLQHNEASPQGKNLGGGPGD
jgi:phosphoesterase RecJ-like protein